MPMKLIFKILMIVLPLIVIGIAYAVYYVAPYGIILMVRVSPEQVAKAVGQKPTPRKYGLAYENVSVDLADSVNLRGYYIPATGAKSNSTVIVLHGINGCKEQQLETAAYLAQNGFNVFAFDSRGHGESGGKFCTYGYYEKKDFSKVIDYILQKDSSQKVAIFGHSMGGAIALQTLAYDPRIKCGVIESTFSTLREIVSDYMKRMFFFGPRAVSDIALNRAAELANFNPDEVRPEESAKQITQPILMAHGDSDKHINIAYGKRNFANLKSEVKIWRTIPGAAHMNVHKIGGYTFMREIVDFLHKYLD